MVHVVMISAVAEIPENEILTLDDPLKEDARRRVAFGYARKLTLTPAEIRRTDVDALRKHFSEKEIVELTFQVCRYNTMNRLADAFGVPLERENVFAPPKKEKKVTPPASD